MASYRGAATISAIHVPPTGLYPKYYFDPLQDWLNDFTIDLGGQPYKPYDPTAAIEIADEARKTLGDLVPTDPAEIQKCDRLWLVEVRSGGGGEADVARPAASATATASGCCQTASRWKMALMAEGETRPVMNRGAAMIVEILEGIRRRRHAGRARQRVTRQAAAAGRLSTPSSAGRSRPGAAIRTCSSSWSPGIRRSTSRAARTQWAATACAGRTPSSTRSSKRSRRLDFDDPKGIELGQRVHQAGGARNADHPDHVLQRVLGL